MFIIQLNHATVVIDGNTILKDISWEWKKGDSWGIVGKNGTGKTTFLKLIRGEIFPENYDDRNCAPRLYRLEGEISTSPIGIKEKIGYIGPELRMLYRRQGWILTARETVATGFFDSHLLYHKPTKKQWQAVDNMLETVGMTRFAQVNIQKLSQGQAARVLLARALVSNPPALILDEVYDGLDTKTQHKLTFLLQEIQQKGTSIIYAGHDFHDLPQWINQIVTINDSTIKTSARKTAKAKDENPSKETPLNRITFIEQSHATVSPDNCIFYLKHVDLYLSKNHIIKDLSWAMLPNENWVITGENGAGKSTFLRLLYGDLFHAENGGSVFRFGKENGNMWDIRENIGYVSYESQSDFSRDVTVIETIALGKRLLFGQFDTLTKGELNAARKVIEEFGIQAIAARKFSDLSHGQRRMTFIARAFINKPKVLLLDEPMSGLDKKSRTMIRKLLGQLIDKGIQLVIASHNLSEDLPKRSFKRLAF